MVEKLLEKARKPRAQWMGLLVVVIILFFWEILFTDQFSPFLDHDGTNLTYAWNHFAAASIKRGVLPLWDPYTQAGRSFIGEMQTGLFYPLKLLLYLWPLNGSGLFSLPLLHNYFAFAHVLGGFFMFLLAEELGLSGFSAFVAALCFSLDGFVGGLSAGRGWAHLVDTAIWLPLILLFLNRALRSQDITRGILYAGMSGLAFGMAILAGGLHVAIMDVLAIVSATGYFAFQAARERGRSSAWRSPWIWSPVVLAVTGATAFAAGAIQLLPSIEYSRLADRYVNEWLWLPATQKIPYSELYFSSSPFFFSSPRFLLAFLFGGAFFGHFEFSPYFGVLPLLLVIIGVWHNWDRPWVRYLTGLAVLAFFYTLGSLSVLHGLLYALVPYLWMAKEPGRFIYLTHFGMALLAGFGAQTLFSQEALGRESLADLARLLHWVVIATAVALCIPALSWKPEMNEWAHFSLLLIICSYGVFVYILRGHRTRTAQFLLVALIMCDLNPFEWTGSNKIQQEKADRNHLRVLLGCHDLASFFKSKPGLFRVQMQVDWHHSLPNIGDLYEVQTTEGRFATVLKDYGQFWVAQPSWEVARVNDLLNVRFIVRPRTAGEPGPVYQDSNWKVYESARYLPRGWVVGRVEREPSQEKTLHRLGERGFDPTREALVSEGVGVGLGGWGEGAGGEVSFEEYRGDRMVVRVRSPGRGMLVLSEMDYPGWRATVNGEGAKIYKADGLLRGVMVPEGESRVVLWYRPVSVQAGAVLSLVAFLGTLGWAGVVWVKGREG